MKSWTILTKYIPLNAYVFLILFSFGTSIPMAAEQQIAIKKYGSSGKCVPGVV